MPGSRIVFWDLRDDLDSIVLDPRDNMLYLSSIPDVPTTNRLRCSVRSPSKIVETERLPDQTVGASFTLATSEVKAGENITNGSAVEQPATIEESSQSNRDPCRPRIDEGSVSNVPVGPDMLDVDEDGKPLKPPEQSAALAAANKAEGSSAEVETPEQLKGGSERGSGSEDTHAGTFKSQESLPPSFPFWTSAKHSPDYCLATYLYWLNLHAPATIHVQGVPLVPQPLSYSAEQQAMRDANTPSEMAGDTADASSTSKECQAAGVPAADVRGGFVAAISRPQIAVAQKRAADSEAGTEGSALGPSLYVFLKQRLYALVGALRLLGDFQSFL